MPVFGGGDVGLSRWLACHHRSVVVGNRNASQKMMVLWLAVA